MASIVFAAVAVLAASGSLGAVGAQVDARVVRVRVRDGVTQRGVDKVQVAIEGQPGGALTDSSGVAELSVRRDVAIVVEARRSGYLPARVAVVGAHRDTTQAYLFLTPDPQALEEVTVTGTRELVGARLSAFEARRKRNAGGAYLTRSDLEKWNTYRVTEALRRVNGVRIVDSAAVRMVASSRMQKPVQSLSDDYLRPCFMRVAIDGQVKEWGYAIDEFPVSEIHGIEVYQGPASLPVELGGLRKDAYCGLVMIWTRSQ
jgi:hypothetical protein